MSEKHPSPPKRPEKRVIQEGTGREVYFMTAGFVFVFLFWIYLEISGGF